MVTNVLPVHAVNRYLWSRIKGAGILSETSYSGVVPLVPVGETPDLIRIIEEQPGIGSLPYIVYTWNRAVGAGQMWYIKTHQIAYAIRSADDIATNKLINLFEQEFQDYDKAAQRINAYLDGLAAGTYNDQLKSFRFKYVNISTLAGQLPAEIESGVSESLITISATFTGPGTYY